MACPLLSEAEVERKLADILQQRVKIHTTNAIERALSRGPPPPHGVLHNAASCDRIVYAVVTHLNTERVLHPL